MRMIRKQIYIGVNQESKLKQISRDVGISEAELIRQGIDRYLSFQFRPSRDLQAWDEARNFMTSLEKAGPVKGKRKWTRDELYD